MDMPAIQPLVDAVQAQLAHRRKLGKPLDSCRLFHGRGRCFPGLEFVCLDWFEPLLLVTLYNEPPPGWLDALSVNLGPHLMPEIQCLLVQHRYRHGAPGECLFGQVPDRVEAIRRGLRFELAPGQQQNSGYFLDMEPGRRWLEAQAPGRRILNLFAYTCAFSVVALAAAAGHVVNVDMSRRALAWGGRNHRLNNLNPARSDFLAEDILKSWGRIKRRGPYDLVIVDPPSYQPGSFVAHKDYAKLIRRIPELMPAGGLILACLNAPELDTDFLHQQFSQSCPTCVFVERLTPSEDFPDIDSERQLKLLVFRYPSS